MTMRFAKTSMILFQVGLLFTQERCSYSTKTQTFESDRGGVFVLWLLLAALSTALLSNAQSRRRPLELGEFMLPSN